MTHSSRSLLRVLTLLNLSISSAVVSIAQTPEIAPSDALSIEHFVTFDNIPERIRRNNPDLAAARFRVEEATGQVHQAGTWSNPNLELGVGGRSDFRERSVEVGLSQKFPLTGRMGLEKEISELRLQVAEAGVSEMERRFIADARAALVDVLAFRQQEELRRQQAELSQQLAEFIGEAAAVGELSMIDAGQARLEAARLASDVRQLEAREIAATGQLRSLLGVSPFEPMAISGELPLAILPSQSIDPARRPGLQAANLEAEAATLGVRLEKARRFADFEAALTAAAERNEDAPIGLESELNFGVHVSLPIPFWNRNGGNVETARARAGRRQKETDALALKIRQEAETAWLEMVEWREILRELSTQLLPLVQKQATDAERAYRQGLGDLQSVLRAREQQLQLGASRIDALRNFHHARVRFDAAAANQ